MGPRLPVTSVSTLIAFVAFIALGALAPAELRAAPGGGRGAFGLMTGLALPNSGDHSFLFGAKIDWRFFPTIKTAAFFHTFGSSVNSTVDASSVGASTRTNLFGVEMAYNIDPDISVGLKTGLISSSSDVRATDGLANSVAFSSSSSGLFVGPLIAYDQPIGRFVMQAEVAYALAFSSATPKGVLISVGVKYPF
jgi:hypothetical protein